MNVSLGGKSFAHLISGRGVIKAAKGKKADEDGKKKEKKKEEDEDDEDEDDGEETKGKKASTPPENDKEDGKKAKGKKAKEKDEDEGDEPCMEEDEDEKDDEDEDEKKNKKKAVGGFDRATMARIESIFASEHASGRVDVACNLAFGSRLSAKEAISVMACLPSASAPSAKRGLSERMETQKNPSVGVDGTIANMSEATTLANRIVAAGARAGQ